MRFTPVAVAAVIALSACGGGSDDDAAEAPASTVSTIPTTEDDSADLFQERDVSDTESSTDEEPGNEDGASPDDADAGDAARGEADPDDADTTGGSSDEGVSTDGEATTGGDGSTSDGATTGDSTSTSATGGTTGGGDTAAASTSDGTSGATIEPDEGGDVCERVQDLADAMDRVSDVEFDTGVGELDVRQALEDVIAALGSVAAVAPADVAADVELTARSFELEIAEDLDDRDLTDAELDFLESAELADAGDRVDDFAVGVCGVELS